MAFSEEQKPNQLIYLIPLTFEPDITYKQYVVSLPESDYLFTFNLNTVNGTGDNLFLSCSAVDNTKIYFSSLRCVFGNYINSIDAGSAHKFFFKTLTSTGTNVSNITFENLNTFVGMYAVVR